MDLGTLMIVLTGREKEEVGTRVNQALRSRKWQPEALFQVILVDLLHWSEDQVGTKFDPSIRSGQENGCHESYEVERVGSRVV